MKKCEHSATELIESGRQLYSMGTLPITSVNATARLLDRILL